MSNSINSTSRSSNSENVKTSGIKGFFERIISIFPKRFRGFISEKLGMNTSMVNRSVDDRTAKSTTKQQEKASTTITAVGAEKAEQTTKQVSATTPENKTQPNPTTSSENTTTSTAVSAEKAEKPKQISTQDKALAAIVEQIFKGEPINISALVRSSNISPEKIGTLEKLQVLTQQLKPEENIFKRCFLYGQTLMFGLSETILKDTICQKIEPTEIQSIFLKILDRESEITQQCLSTPFFHRKSSLRRAYLKFKKLDFNFDFDGYCKQLKKTDKEKMEIFLILGLMKTTYQDQQKYLLHSHSTAS